MLKKEYRLVRNADFQNIFANGKSFPGKHVIVYVLEGPKRYGFVTSKKIGGAVKRNRAKRLMREVVRLHLHELRDDAQVICVARPSIVGCTYAEVEKSMLSTFKRAKLFK